MWQTHDIKFVLQRLYKGNMYYHSNVDLVQTKTLSLVSICFHEYSLFFLYTN